MRNRDGRGRQARGRRWRPVVLRGSECHDRHTRVGRRRESGSDRLQRQGSDSHGGCIGRSYLPLAPLAWGLATDRSCWPRSFVVNRGFSGGSWSRRGLAGLVGLGLLSFGLLDRYVLSRGLPAKRRQAHSDGLVPGGAVGSFWRKTRGSGRSLFTPPRSADSSPLSPLAG